MRMTLEGLNRYNNLFEYIVLPAAINKEILTEVILEQSGDLYPYYQSPSALKRNIENWFLRRHDSFERMARALNAEYDPIENYNRLEDTDVKGESSSKSTSEVNSSNSGSGHNTNIESNTAFDSDSYKEASKNVSDVTNTNVGTTKGKSDGSGESDTRTKSHIHGNIGVTTSQQMIKEELTLREYDIYERIARMFEKSFIIQIY